MAIQGQYKYTIGSYSNCATLVELRSLSNMEDKFTMCFVELRSLSNMEDKFTMCYLQQTCLIAKYYEVRVLEDM